MKNSVIAAMLGITCPVFPVQAGEDCTAAQDTIRKLVTDFPDHVAEIVGTEVSRGPSCACEVVKAAIVTSHADVNTVAAIVEAAINVAPEQMRLIAECAIATAPDALAEVQAVLARLDPNSGEAGTSAKSAKADTDSKDSNCPAGERASMPNPLDFPGQGPVGSTPGGPSEFPLIPAFPPIIINPPEVTEVNPG